MHTEKTAFATDNRAIALNYRRPILRIRAIRSLRRLNRGLIGS